MLSTYLWWPCNPVLQYQYLKKIIVFEDEKYGIYHHDDFVENLTSSLLSTFSLTTYVRFFVSTTMSVLAMKKKHFHLRLSQLTFK